MRQDQWKTILKEVRMVNLIRILLFHNPVKMVLTNVTRTPVQIFRNAKKKRIHHQWSTNRKVRMRQGISIFGAMLNALKSEVLKTRETILISMVTTTKAMIMMEMKNEEYK